MKKTTTNSVHASRRSFLRQTAILSSFFIVPRHVLGRGFLAPSDTINIGFIGTGKQSGGLKDGLLKSFLATGEVKVVAACDVYKEKLSLFVAGVNRHYAEKSDTNTSTVCQGYGDFRELLARPDIDAVVVASPDHWHAAHVVWAAKAGKDIYCEKPLSLTIEEGRAMVKATRKYNRVFQTGNMQRSWPEFRQAVELVRNGYIGQLSTIKVQVGGPPVPYNLPAEPLPAGLDWDFWLGPNLPAHYNNQLAPAPDATIWAQWRKYKEFGGGGMTDWGAHMFDIAQWALDMDHSGPISIVPPDGGGHPFLTYTYANGVTLTHEDFATGAGVRFVGSEGHIDVRRGKLESSINGLATKVIGANEKHVYKSENHYKDFLTAMRSRTKPIADVETGHRTASVCTLGNIAYALKRPLEWNPGKERFKNDREANQLLSREVRKEWAV
jgi:predicted dehydrogenase